MFASTACRTNILCHNILNKKPCLLGGLNRFHRILDQDQGLIDTQPGVLLPSYTPTSDAIEQIEDLFFSMVAFTSEFTITDCTDCRCGGAGVLAAHQCLDSYYVPHHCLL